MDEHGGDEVCVCEMLADELAAARARVADLEGAARVAVDKVKSGHARIPFLLPDEAAAVDALQAVLDQTPVAARTRPATPERNDR